MTIDLGILFNMPRRDGTREFVCTDCGYRVFVAVALDDDGTPVCRTCQFIGEHPQLPEDIKSLLRGEDLS